jgi:antitoxin component YwqK of YwqJK toxin-antitoxin module
MDRASLAMVGAAFYHDGKPFTGYAVVRNGDRLLSRAPLLKGREHGLAEAWYPNGVKRFEKNYVRGRREGIHRGWWDNGQLQFIHHYADDLFEGEQVAFYRNGVRSELRHYKKGHEEGRQRFWNAEGLVIANYTMASGRRYGIVGRHDCEPVHSR